MNIDVYDDVDAIARKLDEEEQALFVSESDRLERLFREHYAQYARLNLGWPNIARVISSVMEWPDFRDSGDPFVADIRQFGNVYGWSHVYRCLAKAMDQQMKAAA